MTNLLSREGLGGCQSSLRQPEAPLAISAYQVTSLALTAYSICLNSSTALARHDLV